MRFIILGLGVGMIIFLSTPGMPQTREPTPTILYVNPQGDQTPLNQSHTFVRLQDALDYAQAQGDRPQEIRLGPGTYRESLSLRGQPNREMAPLTIKAMTPGTVILSGAEEWQHWQREQTQPTAILYSHDWPYDWGVSGNPWTEFDIELAEIVQRGEMVWQAGRRVQQYLSLEALNQGTTEMGFYIDEGGDRLYLRLPLGLDPATANLDVTTQNQGMVIEHRQNVTLEGLRFEHYGGTFTAALAIRNSQNIQIQNCRFANNNWAGLSMSRSQQMQISQSQFRHNGLRGLGGWRLEDLTVKDVETRENNWRGAWGNFYDWDAGEKFFYLRRAHFDRYRAIANQATGLWLDTDNRDVLIENSQLNDNQVGGLFLEAGMGPITVQNCIIANNHQVAPNYLQTPGVFGWAAQNVTLKNNLIMDNDFAQVGVRDLSDRQITVPETGESQTLVSQDWHLENNWILSTQGNSFLLITLNAQPFLNTLQAQNNYWLSPGDRPIRIQDQSLTLSEWQNQVFGNNS